MFPNDNQINWYRVLERCAICNQGFSEQEALRAVIVGYSPAKFAHRNCEGQVPSVPLMEHEFTLLKQYLKELPDEKLREIYLKELDRESTFEGLAEGVFLWIAKDPQRSDWAILNEIARRWASSEP